MAEIDVEPVERIEEDVVPTGIDAPEYVLYGGKGGVGKTTMAAATALASARDGTRTLVVSTDPAHSLSDTFEYDIPSEATRIREEIPLYAAEIDPDAALEEQAGMLGGENPLGGMLGDEDDGPMASLLGGAMPGADEAAAMQKLLEFLDDERFERVVVDTAPTGHTLRLLELPELMDTMVGRMMSLRQRFQGMMDGVKGMFGGGADDPEEGMDDLDAFKERIQDLRRTLRDPSKTDFRVVMIPEEMSVFESKRLLAQLDEFGIPVGTVIVNRVMENLADVTDSVDSSRFATPNLEECEFCQQRWEVQQGALREAQDVFRGHTIKRVPLFADEVRGEEMLRVVAACLD
ncbi:arsenite-activated ATPase ArsA [Haladaptatus paucihalophilus DX253]|uniref:Arsenite efflux ATP-binding protein ArsA n=1 Tax=Haladaptatus paucihalophilus DX253 TaxID=797209 RepID=E7QRK1_HALPU|nr:MULTISPECIES: TRC40/GET3/ArsA family transport-energizing ATPase [Haladaptatus]EFW92620.1 arsenite-activated ATPase ArsA [Haladaptatus paucihalophilus DX253]GKZ13779.1 arsenic-transporting ATPase [Haladaptatus sp. T7]SHK17464.1 arsenite efflux ATP-binding protein ArsA [Haladaptatus paucihalophilus DX253]